MKSKVIIVSLIFLFICGILFSVVYINGFRDQTINTDTINTDTIVIIDESDSIIEEDHEYTPYQWLSYTDF